MQHAWLSRFIARGTSPLIYKFPDPSLLRDCNTYEDG